MIIYPDIVSFFNGWPRRKALLLRAFVLRHQLYTRMTMVYQKISQDFLANITNIVSFLDTNPVDESKYDMWYFKTYIYWATKQG